MCRLMILLPMMLMIVLPLSEVEASGRPRGLLRRLAAARAASDASAIPPAPAEHRPHGPPPATWSMTPEMYPQWYGGFHGRVLQNYGFPAGDLGVRGQAW